MHSIITISSMILVYDLVILYKLMGDKESNVSDVN